MLYLLQGLLNAPFAKDDIRCRGIDMFSVNALLLCYIRFFETIKIHCKNACILTFSKRRIKQKHAYSSIPNIGLCERCISDRTKNLATCIAYLRLKMSDFQFRSDRGGQN